MSATTAAAPEDRRTSSTSWVSLSRAARTLGRSTDIVKSAALAGGIRFRSMPGARTVYNLDDCRRLSEGQ
jgi:hypothetical protein